VIGAHTRPSIDPAPLQRRHSTNSATGGALRPRRASPEPTLLSPPPSPALRPTPATVRHQSSPRALPGACGRASAERLRVKGSGAIPLPPRRETLATASRSPSLSSPPPCAVPFADVRSSIPVPPLTISLPPIFQACRLRQVTDMVAPASTPCPAPWRFPPPPLSRDSHPLSPPCVCSRLAAFAK
jgi:hypothetical protein